MDAPAEQEFQSDEEHERVYRRYREAREYEFTKAQSRIFSESNADVGLLRQLKAQGCPPRFAFRITRPLEDPPPR